MRKEVISRIIDKRTLILYFFTYMLLLIVSNEGDSIIDIFGGFSTSSKGGMNVIKIMRWNLCVLPPVAVSIIYMDKELGTFGIYTIVRCKHMRHWWCMHWMAVVFANLAYVIIPTITGIVIDKNIKYGKESYGLFFIVFLSHILLMSILSVLIFIVCRSLNMSILFFGIVEIFLVAMGSLYPQISPFLLPFWGMVKNENDRLIVISISIVLIMASILYTMKWLKSEKIVTYIRGK